MGIWSRIRVHRHNIVPLTHTVSNTLTIKYDILNTVSNTLEIQYDIRNLVSNTLELLYDIRNVVSNTVEFQYNINGIVSNTVEFVYSILAGTVSGGRKSTSGTKLKTIDEEEPIRHYKKKLTKYAGFHIEAPLRQTQTVRQPMKASLVVQMATNSFHMFADTFRKIVFVGSISAPLKHTESVRFRTESKLRLPVTIGKMESKLDFYPVLSILRRNIESILNKKTRSFVFNEVTNMPPVGTPQDQDRERTFQEPSSFVGKVTYNIDDQSMEVILNGKTYNYCRVPERIFDAFQGAQSKGSYYNRVIKNQFNC